MKKVGSSSAFVAWKAPASKSKLTSYAIYIRKMGDEKYRLYDYSSKTIVNIGEGKSVPPDSTKLWMEVSHFFIFSPFLSHALSFSLCVKR